MTSRRDTPKACTGTASSLLHVAALLLLLLSRSTTRAAPDKDPFRIYPRRAQEEAAVIEWGHSAIISALDAAVAEFGPQSNQAALLEVETMPILADPITGVWDNDETTETNQNRKLNNAEEVHGNVVIMTDAKKELDGLDLALLAQFSGAAALIVVHVDEKRPDDLDRLMIPTGRESEAAFIDIPVVSISMNAANVLTSATVSSHTKKSEIINNGLPERIRLYAGGDRPFFEDIESAKPTLYVIHNMLTEEECDTLIQKARPRVEFLDKKNPLEYTAEVKPFENVHRATLWQGLWQGPGAKAIVERMEQVTGFPSAHYSDFIVDKLTKGSKWNTHYDSLLGGFVPLASMTIFLSEIEQGGEVVYASVASGQPVKIKPTKGMAVVHHNTDDRHHFDKHSMHALLPVNVDTDDYFVARKLILSQPLSNARRVALPIYAFLNGGALPKFVVHFHDYMVEQFGVQDGPVYFDKVVVFIPLLILLGTGQLIASAIQKKLAKPKQESPKERKGKRSKKKD